MMKQDESLKLNPIPIKKFYMEYGRNDAQRQKNEISKYYVKDNTYFMMYTSNISSNDCQLILSCEKDGQYYLGYSLQSQGFPQCDGVPPIWKDQKHLSQVEQIEVDQSTLLFKINNKNIWKFRVNTKELQAQWISIIYKLHKESFKNMNLGWKSKLKLSSVLGQQRISTQNLSKFITQELDIQQNTIITFRSFPDIELKKKFKTINKNQEYIQMCMQLKQTKQKLAIRQKDYKFLAQNYHFEEQLRKNVVQQYQKKEEQTTQILQKIVQQIEDVKKKNEEKGSVVELLNKVHQNNFRQKQNEVKQKSLQEQNNQTIQMMAKTIITYKQLQQRVKELEIELVDKQNKIKEKMYEKNEIINSHSIRMNQLEDSEKKAKNIMKENQKKYDKQLLSLRTQNQKLKNQRILSAQKIQNNDLKISEQEKELKNLRTQIQELETLKESLSKIIEKNANKTKKAEEEIAKKQNGKQKQIQKEIIRLNEELKIKTEDCSEVKNKLQSLEKILEQKQKQIQNVRDEADKENKAFTLQKNKSQSKIKILSEQILQQKAKNLSLIQQITHLEKTEAQLQALLSKVEKQHQERSQNELKEREHLMKVEKELLVLQQQKNNNSSSFFFHGQILNIHQEHKFFLKDSIQTLRQLKISKTVQIFASDELNPTSYHKYIDQVPNIVLIVKTESGIFFAGYSQCAISGNKEKIANKSGLLLSLTNKKVFPLAEGKRSVTFDNYFLIFGNSQIRIKHGQWKVFSNFGIANGFFNPMGSNINDLLAAGKERELKFTRYEVHRVYFDGDS